MPNKVHISPKVGRGFVNRASGIPRTGPAYNQESIGLGSSQAPPIPTGNMLARWNFNSLALTEGQGVSSVNDISGNGYNLVPYTTSQTGKLPIYTKQTINGLGGLFMGGIGPGGHGMQTGAVVFQSAPSGGQLIGTGSQTFPAPTGLNIIVGQPVYLFDQSTPPISGTSQAGNTETGAVTAYGSGSITINVTSTVGSGTIANWIIIVTNALSSTSLTIGTGSIGPLTVTPASAVPPTNSWCTVYQTSNPSNNWMTGVVTASNSSTGVMSFTSVYTSGSGTLTNWTVVASPQAVSLGSLVTSNTTIAWNETPLTVLVCAQLGNAGGPGGSILQVGNVAFAQRGANSSWPKQFADYNSSSVHGTSAFAGEAAGTINKTFPFYAGPVCMGFVNGFGGSTQTRLMFGRGRRTLTTTGWAASGSGTGTSPFMVGFTGFQGNNLPDSCVLYEVVVYSRTLSDNELDQWQTYCNYIYKTPVYQYNGGSGSVQAITTRIVFVGDSVCDAQNSIYGVSLAGATAQALATLKPAALSYCEFLNYGVGSATEANHNTNVADYTNLVDTGITTIFIHTGWLNDLGSRTPGDVYNGTGGTPSTSIANLISSLHTAGANKIILSTSIDGHGDSSTLITNNQSLNTLIKGNTIANVDQIVDFAGSWIQPYVQGAPYMAGHLDNFTYLQWGKQLAQCLVSNGYV